MSPHQTVRAWLDHLEVADPEAARILERHLDDGAPALVADRVPAVVDAVIAAMAREMNYGHALADGAGRLLSNAPSADLDGYLNRVRKAAEKSTTLAMLLARHLVPVVAAGDLGLIENVDRVIGIMLQKGTYTLKAPLETLSRLIDTDDMPSAHGFVDLLGVVYALDTSYNRTVYLTHTLARAVKGFVRPRRRWQIKGLKRIMQTDERLADEYLQGLAGGLHLLSEAALERFLDQAIRRCRQDLARGARFLSLGARRAKEICQDLQVAVPLSAVRSQLHRYLMARTGLAVGVQALSVLPGGGDGTNGRSSAVRCDGRTIYLPDEMDLLENRKANTERYKLLARFEAGTIEFGSYELDVEKVWGQAAPTSADHAEAVSTDRSELDRFAAIFDHPRLALDLFTLFEHARIARLTARRYPALAKRLAAACENETTAGGTLYPLYRHLVSAADNDPERTLAPIFRTLAEQFEAQFSIAGKAPETSARLAMAAYPVTLDVIGAGPPAGYEPLQPPFGRRFRRASFTPYHRTCHLVAGDIQKSLAEHRIHVYRSDVRQILVRQNGQLDAADLRPLVIKEAETNPTSADDLARIDLQRLMCARGLGAVVSADDDMDAYRYREWDGCMADYLPDRVRVREHVVHGVNTSFYHDTLNVHHGLARRIRHAFELLRPEGLTILRQWREGDAFDYRALLDYAIDRKAGLIPSDRLFIKRIKRLRDVATLLLVDLSRSTANVIDDGGTRVLDVEKQAIVLFCEALSVVGDRFAVAGFSGTGPLGVDYYRVKDLAAPFDDTIRARIGAMSPQRSTRMGAAIRHATARLKSVQARVRLMMILGDGFPNDIEYKGAYAVEDTRRAVMEARAAAVHVKAITVNVSDNGQLDRLYGKSHHILINHVRDLPDRLVRVYSALTRH